MKFKPSLIALSVLAFSASAFAEDKVLNLYSARHYQTDEALYADFTRDTGIKINRIEGKEDELLERIRNEGANSPADVLLTVDAARLAKAHELGLFSPVRSKVLEARIPAHLRTEDWFSFSTRARVIVYNKDSVTPDSVRNYEDLARPALKGKVCSRSGSHPYNLSLGAAMIAHQGEAKAEEWARGLVANFARSPKGGDTDQIKAVAAGECQVALTNTYYVARLMRSTKPDEVKLMEKVGVVWPNQATTGTHINVSGGGVLKHAPHREAGIKFLEYLASDKAQRYFADGNNEWPAVEQVKVVNPALDALGKFKADALPVRNLAMYQVKAQMIYDRTGYR
ncbi:Fe(3+) ABC transporter substrate-binding protein [Zoogloea sp.]|jgi:iron(III) transport system substrate-binding protein|uniref:Fe(3+) ABC transporter substrate-binding protein n=1 Tax=Zoogloea sp. TaxID=49181 RepID=UPI0011DA89F5|nr:Fe(3+) ABC transporter substrate-binding protein [Zoogloea sp.]MBK6653487.1 Fe(3+) ABC transporter substrate-binding protein [Zoogloea sp.]MBK7847643.1 Fe(3+) ABC transporter substrate-binding protein [Zoogloea sp.]MBP7443702.1 Fe(3+) ABC transporter substrate-binding protein [Zoogloea sp.]TXG94669.1 MAG: Fe(3+) ABC transporter substrate-binding protein [Zoogloea sp.]HOY00870.1 Fe(3+) ABC transporter substrate-binding protein [Zoogloea sp.]